ncbi:MAG: hypothetical protein HRT77_11135 [Halioglobus sp.]|nr:hypothetical protein [Halioglobus sp.]
MSLEFGTSVALLNTGLVLLVLVASFVAPFIGRLADRVPIRGLLLLGSTLSMLSLFAVGMAPALVPIALGFLCFSLGLNASVVLAVCYPPHFTNIGYSAAQAGWFLATAGIAGLMGQACLARLGDAARSYAK